jgi:hypothetical protein
MAVVDSLNLLEQTGTITFNRNQMQKIKKDKTKKDHANMNLQVWV